MAVAATTSELEVRYREQVRRYVNNDPEFDRAMANGIVLVERVSSDDAGRITIEVIELDDQMDEPITEIYTTDSHGDRQVGAGTWLELGDVTQETRRRRVCRSFMLG